MDPLGDPLTTRPNQMGWESTREPDPSWRFGFSDNLDRQFGYRVDWTQIRTRSDGPEPLLTLCASIQVSQHQASEILVIAKLIHHTVKAAAIIVWLCHRWVYTSWVDPLANHAVDTVYLFRLNLWQEQTKICIDTRRYICASIINWVTNVSCIALTLCSTS